jgi:hypothetical protein
MLSPFAGHTLALDFVQLALQDHQAKEDVFGFLVECSRLSHGAHRGR